MIQVSSKKAMPAYLESLKASQIPFKVLDNETIEISTAEDPTIKNRFVMVIALHIGFEYFRTIINENFLNRPWKTEADLQTALNDMHEMFGNTRYYRNLVTILFYDYVQGKEKISLDAFLLFNMKGFKEDVLQEIENYCNEEEEMERDNEYVDALVLDMQDVLVERGVDFHNFKELHLHESSGHLSMTIWDGEFFKERVTENYVFELFDGEFDLKMIGPFHGWQEKFRDLPAVCRLYPIQKIMIHRSVRVEAYSFLDAIKDSMGIAHVALEVCKGCEKCDADKKRR